MRETFRHGWVPRQRPCLAGALVDARGKDWLLNAHCEMASRLFDDISSNQTHDHVEPATAVTDL